MKQWWDKEIKYFSFYFYPKLFNISFIKVNLA